MLKIHEKIEIRVWFSKIFLGKRPVTQSGAENGYIRGTNTNAIDAFGVRHQECLNPFPSSVKIDFFTALTTNIPFSLIYDTYLFHTIDQPARHLRAGCTVTSLSVLENPGIGVIFARIDGKFRFLIITIVITQ